MAARGNPKYLSEDFFCSSFLSTSKEFWPSKSIAINPYSSSSLPYEVIQGKPINFCKLNKLLHTIDLMFSNLLHELYFIRKHIVQFLLNSWSLYRDHLQLWGQLPCPSWFLWPGKPQRRHPCWGSSPRGDYWWRNLWIFAVVRLVVL